MAADAISVSVLQVAYGDGETVAGRIERVVGLIRRQRGADLVVLPELWAPGYFTFDTWAEHAETLEGPTITALAAAAAEIGAVVHAGSILEREAHRAILLDAKPGERGLWNTSVILDTDGSVLSSYRKIHPFGFGDGEPMLIDPGRTPTTVTLPGNQTHSEVVLGLATCYDLRFPELFRELMGQGATLFTIPAAWPAARVQQWELLGRARAIENQAFVVQCNTAGTHGGVVLGGHSQVISPMGEVLARAGDGEEVLEVQLNFGLLQEYRENFPVLADRRL